MSNKYTAAYNKKFNELATQVELTSWMGDPPADWKVTADKIAHEYARSQTQGDVVLQLCSKWNLHGADARRMLKDAMELAGRSDKCVEKACAAFNNVYIRKMGAPIVYPTDAMRAAIIAIQDGL